MSVPLYCGLRPVAVAFGVLRVFLSWVFARCPLFLRNPSTGRIFDLPRAQGASPVGARQLEGGSGGTKSA